MHPLNNCIFVHGEHCLNPQCEQFETMVSGEAKYPFCLNKEKWDKSKGKGEFPSTVTQVMSFLKSMTNFKKSSKAEQVRRLAICAGCEFRRFNRCTKCGCFIYKKVKKENNECPEKRW